MSTQLIMSVGTAAFYAFLAYLLGMVTGLGILYLALRRLARRLESLDEITSGPVVRVGFAHLPSKGGRLVRRIPERSADS